jgi:hypothetical protein
MPKHIKSMEWKEVFDALPNCLFSVSFLADEKICVNMPVKYGELGMLPSYSFAHNSMMPSSFTSKAFADIAKAWKNFAVPGGPVDAFGGIKCNDGFLAALLLRWAGGSRVLVVGPKSETESTVYPPNGLDSPFADERIRRVNSRCWRAGCSFVTKLPIGNPQSVVGVSERAHTNCFITSRSLPTIYYGMMYVVRGKESTVSSLEMQACDNLLLDMELQGPLRCYRCLRSREKVALVPCGHARFCGKCASKMNVCPICTLPVRQVMVIYD